MVEPQLVANQYHHVHHADTLLLLERARVAWLNRAGLSLEGLLKDGLLLVLTEISVEYLRELFEGEIEVTVENPLIQRRRLTIEQAIFKRMPGGVSGEERTAAGEGLSTDLWKEAIRAKIHLALVSTVTRRAVSPSESFLRFFMGAQAV